MKPDAQSDRVIERLVPVDAFMLASGTGCNPYRSNGEAT